MVAKSGEKFVELLKKQVGYTEKRVSCGVCNSCVIKTVVPTEEGKESTQVGECQRYSTELNLPSFEVNLEEGWCANHQLRRKPRKKSGGHKPKVEGDKKKEQGQKPKKK